MARLKPSEEKRLREMAENDPRIAGELKKHDQAYAALSDLLTQQKAQTRKQRNREIMLIGASILSECENNSEVRKAITKFLNKHLTRSTDRNFINSRGWEVAENETKANFSTTSTTDQ